MVLAAVGLITQLPAGLLLEILSEKIRAMTLSHFHDQQRSFAPVQRMEAGNSSWQSAGHESQGLDISGFFRIVKMQWPLIVLITVLSLSGALAYTSMATSKYTASSKILINPQPKRVFGNDYIPQDGNTNQILIESQTRVIASNAVLARVVDAQQLTLDPEFSDAANKGLWEQMLQMAGFETQGDSVAIKAKSRQEALRRLHERLAVKRPSQTYVVEVAVSSRDAEKAARLSRAVASAYIADQAESRADATRQISKLLQDRLATLRQKVQASEASVQRFKSRHNIIETSGSLVNERQLSSLSDDLLAARTRMIEVRARADRVRAMIRSGMIPESFDGAIKSRLVATLREQYAKASRRESQLASTLGSRHPQLIAARARVARSKSLIGAELRRIAGSLQADFQIEKKRVASLESRLHKSRGVTDLTNEARVRLAGLEREATANRAVYERVLSKARESNAQEKINLIDARIISYASTPLWASWPKKKIILPLALLLGLGLGVAAALLNDYRQDRFISSGDVEHMLGLRTLGAIPALDTGRFSSIVSRLGRGVGVAGASDPEQSSYYKLYLELSRVGSPYATAVMGLVRNLLNMAGPRGSHSVMLVSSADREGSSSIAWSTAISAAMANRRVLLVDGDGGNGELAATLAPNSQTMLRTVLAGKGKLADMIVEDKGLGLSFLPIVAAGKGKERGSRQINWSDYQLLLAQLPEISRNYDLVLVDGGAILNSGLAHLLVDYVDDVTLVVRTDTTSRQTVQEAMQALDVPAGKMLGAIVSQVDPKTV